MATTETENAVFFKLVAQLHEITAQLVRQHQRNLEAVVLNNDQLRSNLDDKRAIYLGKSAACEQSIEVDTATIEAIQVDTATIGQRKAFSFNLCGVCSDRDSDGIQEPRMSKVKSMASDSASFAPESTSKANRIAANANTELLVPNVDQLVFLTEVDTCRTPRNGDIDALAQDHAEPVLPKAGESKSPAEDGFEMLSENSTSIKVHSEGHGSKTRSQDAIGKDNSVCKSHNSRMSVGNVVRSMAGAGSMWAFMMRHPWNEHLEFQRMNLSEFFAAEGLEVRKNSAFPRASECLEQEVSIANRYWYMCHPESKSRGLWVLLSMAFLLIDFFMVPVSICFGTDGHELTTDLDLVAMGFWTADIFHTFATGERKGHHLEMRPRVIACNYLKSWFLFDVSLVLPEWILLATDSEGGAGVALVRLVRWGRLTRLLRMTRIVNFKRLKPMVRHVIYSCNIPKVYIEFVISVITITSEIIFCVHVLSCLWFLLGSGENGWVELNGLGSSSVGHSYLVSMHWTLNRLHGLQSHNIMQRSSDIIIDSLLVYFSLMFAAYYGGILIAFASKGNGESYNLWRLSIIYVKRHRISKETEMKISRWLEVQDGDAKGRQQEENTLLEALPESVQNDVIFEVRSRSLSETIFFYDLLRVNAPAVRQLCIDGMSGKAWSEGEILWDKGDLGISTVFIASGGAHYVRETSYDLADLLRRRPQDLLTTNEEKLDQNCIGEQVPIGCPVSEPVLWTHWTHQGTLVATEHLASLSIDPIQCAAVLQKYRASLCHAVKYANHFCRKMNLLEEPADDLTRFPELVCTELDIDIGDAQENEHLMFLSHYKVEAGTEATLMRDSFHNILQDEPNHPANLFQVIAFIDSENLTDLAELKNHVIGSLNLVLLLTPGVLSRPWCLVEIVTAVRHEIDIVPVEIQRPGSKYSYPDDGYYAGILKGEGLPPGAVELLGTEGITLMDVEQAIREVFLKIALPFSPHKSRAVRDAELHDILKRCSLAKKP